MLTFLKNGNLFEYVESIDRDTNDINSYEAYYKNIFIYFEWANNEELRLVERDYDGICISQYDDVNERHKITQWRDRIVNIVYDKLSDTLFYKYMPYYIISRDDYKKKMSMNNSYGGILECIGYVMLYKEYSIRIIDSDSPDDIYIYCTLDDNLVITTVNSGEFQKSIEYYEDLIDEIENGTTHNTADSNTTETDTTETDTTETNTTETDTTETNTTENETTENETTENEVNIISFEANDIPNNVTFLNENINTENIMNLLQDIPDSYLSENVTITIV